MRKVTTINLNGRAYQLEDQAYENLHAYLKRAEAGLAKNPDKSEIMTDLEQSIADKCERLLKNGKTVVTTQQVENILKQMGEVEGDDATETKRTGEPGKPKRLFVVREGAMLMGVCQGIGAYFGIDANLVRLGFVLATIFTSGVWIVVYLALGMLLPVAKNDTELAEAYGKPITAQDIVARAKERVPDAENMQRLAGVATKALRVLAQILGALAAMTFGILASAWLWTLWQVVLGRVHFYDQLHVLNGWREWLVITAVFLIVALPFLLLYRLFDRVADGRSQTHISTISESSLAVLWGVAVITIVAFCTAYIPNVRDYVRGHKGHFDVGSSSICVDDTLCNATDNRVFYKY